MGQFESNTESSPMSVIDVNFFLDQHILPKERIISNVDCRVPGNPFDGSLILTNNRLIFIRKEQPGASFRSLRLSTVDLVDYRIESSVEFVLFIRKNDFEEEFQLMAMDNAKQTEFFKLVQLQVERRKLLDDDMQEGSDCLPGQEVSTQNSKRNLL